MGKIWDWHKKAFSDPTPVIQWGYHDDGEGNVDFGIDFFGSKFFSKKRTKMPMKAPMIDCNRRE